MFELSDDLNLPATAATQTFAFLGRRGSGKSYGAGKLAEVLLDGGQQVVIVDPVGVWFGLRHDARGNAAGIPIPIFGGQHGDIPLEATAGALVAQLVAVKRISVVLDVSGFSGAEQRRFVADFATELLHLKKSNRTPVMTIWDESQEFVPQQVRPDHARMVGAMEKIVKLGRNFGIGCALLSQRPQAVNKDVLNQTEVLIVFQLTGPQERKVIEGWVSDNGFGKAELAEIPRLQPGHAFVWSPQWLGTFKPIQVGRKRTFDASATPEAGAVVAAGAAAPIDLDQVRESMAATIEEAKANDPKVLREEIGQLRAALAKRPPNFEAHETVRKLRSDLDAANERLRDLDGVTGHEVRRLRTLETFFERVIGAVDGYREAGDGKYARGSYAPAAQSLQPAPTPLAPRHELPRAPAPPKHNASGLPAGAREMLLALAGRYPSSLTRVQIATLASIAPTGGTFAKYLSTLRSAQLIVVDGELVGLTDLGLSKAGGQQAPKRPGEILAIWREKLPGKARDMLELLAAEPRPWTKADLAKRLDLDEAGGTFAKYLSILRSNSLAVKTSGGFQVVSTLVQR